MQPGIQPLPTDVVHLMAAGEVIDSLAAVVRELVENALDAGATRISVAVSPEHWRVRVADNGCGISLADLQQAASPHSTSKIRTRQDLWEIGSLGFRGEALHSLAQLSELEILSQAGGMAEGWRVTYTPQGEVSEVTTAAIAPGTIVSVSNLFGNWLARRQGLPAPSQQMRQVQITLQQLALCHPHVTWQVQQNDRDWFSIWAGATAQQILPQFLRELRPSDLQELVLPANVPQGAATEDAAHSLSLTPDASLYLLLGLPDRCHRYRPDWVRVAVNGRVVHLPELEQTILTGFRRTLPRDRYPICFLHLHVAANQVDWNRHPAKSEIYLHHLKAWQNQVLQAIDQALRLNPTALPESTYLDRVSTLLKTAESATGYTFQRQIQPIPALPTENMSTDSAISADLEVSHAPVMPVNATVVNSIERTNPIDQSLSESFLPPALSLRAIAQVHNTYIVAEHTDGLWLVEQHIAHERVLYEQLCDRWQLISLDPPIMLHHLTLAQQEQLQRLGLEVDPFGEQLWAIRTAPNLLAQRQDCADALLELSLGGDLQTAQVATACRSAIRNGVPLTLPEMQSLLEQWQQTRHPRTCPHGRPIYLSLEESALARFFRRHWVIGKSHGI
ncbi:MAG: DNA mismatch repair endonuclease MutL [Scytolyngbya sp. HA4215-MV1]|nr:DNA mismatch repair endonuclease MutL [Scytolyngbya sp. HA4215-MV1]